MKKLCIALAFFLASPAFASPAGDAASGYELVSIKLRNCRSTHRLGVLQSELGKVSAEDAYRTFLGCKAEVTKEAKAVYSRVLAKVKSSDGKKALKDYQVALMSAVEGMEPKANELKIHFDQRTAALDASIEKAWQRLQLEL